MKNQYFGDLNDYHKYGLLRVLQRTSGFRLLLAWMLTPDDSRSDGLKTDYLSRKPPYERYDPELYLFLREQVSVKGRREVRAIEESDLLPRTDYFGATVPDTVTERSEWFDRLVERARAADVVFLDPDNGIEVRSKPAGRKGSSKYLLWNEMVSLWQLGVSLILYQHFPRKPRLEFSVALCCTIRDRIGARFVQGLATSNVLFMSVVQEKHESEFEGFLQHLQESWAGEFRDMGASRVVLNLP